MRGIALLESERRSESGRFRSGAAASVILHAGILAFAFAATANAHTHADRSDAILVPLYRWRPEPPPAQKRTPAEPSRPQQRPQLPAITVPSIGPITTTPSVLPTIALSPVQSAPATTLGSTGSATATTGVSSG